MGYTLPGTYITEIPTAVTPSVGSTQRIPCFVGTASAYKTVNYESVVRTSTGLTPLADSLVYTSSGIYSVTSVGSQKGLIDYKVGINYNVVNNKIVWVDSTQIANGATYYVTYSYMRAEEDYGFKTFNSYASLVADLGPNIPANTLSMIADIAFNYCGIPQIAVVQVQNDITADYLAALQLIKYRDVQTVCLLNSSVAVRSAGIQHVVERSLPANGRFRMLYTGAPIGTALGSIADPTSVCGISESIKQSRVIMVNASRALYYYNDPTTLVSKSTIVDGAFISAVAGVYKDSFTDPTTTLINKTLPGIYLMAEDYDNFYSEAQLAVAGNASCFIMQYSAGNALVIDDLTTDNTSVDRNNVNVITVKDFIAKDLIAQLNRTFKGSLIRNPSQFTNDVSNFIRKIMNAHVANGYIAAVVAVTANINADRADTIDFYYGYNAVYTAKYFDGSFSIVV